MTDIESLDIPDESLAPARKTFTNPKFPFPAVSVREKYKGAGWFNFNKHASALFEAGDRIRISTTPDYIIFEKADARTGTHRIIHPVTGCAISAASFIREQKLRLGCYRLYKCKQGYAIKRNEPLEEY